MSYIELFIYHLIGLTIIYLIGIRYCAIFRHRRLGMFRGLHRDLSQAHYVALILAGLCLAINPIIDPSTGVYICLDCNYSSATLVNDGGMLGRLIIAYALLGLVHGLLILVGDVIRIARRQLQCQPELQARIKRFFWQSMAGFTTLLVIGMMFLLTGCSSLYERARLRYATAKVDTVAQAIKVVVPADSVSLTVPNDTTVVYKEIHHDRARLVFKRDKNQTTVQAFCDTLVITKKVATQITTQHWGVDPKYKQQAETRLSIIWGLSAFIGLMVIVFVLSRRYQFTVTKKTNGSGAAA